jgi:hypothetical protein
LKKQSNWQSRVGVAINNVLATSLQAKISTQ